MDNQSQARERLLRVFRALDTCRAEKHHGVLDALCLEAGQRLEIFGEDANGPGVLAVEEFVITIGKRLHVVIIKRKMPNVKC